MRIAMIVGSLSRQAGGLFWSVRRLSQTLQEAGAEVHVFGLRDKHTEADLAEWFPLQPTILKPGGPRAIGYAPELKKSIAAVNPDVVHLHGIWQALSITVSHFAKAGTPTIISPRGMLDPWALANSRLKKRLAWSAWEKQNLTRATCLHVLNSTESVATREVLPHANTATIPNGIDMPAQDIARKPIAEQDAPRLLFISRIHPKKGLKAFLGQWADVRPRLSKPWQLRIAGPDEIGHLSVLKARTKELGLEESVTFIGPVYGDQKERELAEASAFVLPSYSEGLPMAVLEAWAAGLPSLITRECNLPEAFAEGAAVEITNDPGLLFNGLEKVNLDAIGKRAKVLAAEQYGWASIAARHLNVCRWMMSNDGSAEIPADLDLG